MIVAIEQFGQGEVETGLRLRTGLHRDAEAGSAGFAAVHGDEEIVLAAAADNPCSGYGPLDEHPVLNGDRVKFAGAHAEKRKFRYGFLGGRLQ